MSRYQSGKWEIEERVFSEWPADILRVNYVGGPHGGHIARSVELRGARKDAQADGVYVKLATLREWRDFNGIGVSTADCLPLVLLTEKEALGLHVSRKTLINGLLDNVSSFIDPVDVTNVYIGPHICPEHFTFEWEGAEITRFAEKFPDAAEQDEAGIWSLSTRDAVQHYLDEWKIDESLIEEDTRCTLEASELASYRRDGKPLTRQLATIIRASANA